MNGELNHFLGIPKTIIPGCDVCSMAVRSQVSFRPTYLVIPKVIADDFEILDLKIGKNSQLVSGDPIHASVFSGEVVVLKDKVVDVVSDLPLAMKMDVYRPELAICLTVRNLNACARNFFGAIVGPPVGNSSHFRIHCCPFRDFE